MGGESSYVEKGEEIVIQPSRMLLCLICKDRGAAVMQAELPMSDRGKITGGVRGLAGWSQSHDLHLQWQYVVLILVLIVVFRVRGYILQYHVDLN